MDEKLAIIKKALEMGAEIELGFCQYPLPTKEEAETLIKVVSKAVGESYREIRKDGSSWFRVRGSLSASVFFKPEELRA